MPSAKSTASRPIPTLADATAKTRSLIEDLQARLTGGEGGANELEPPRRAPRRETAVTRDVVAKDMDANEVVAQELVAREETEDDLARQLQAYFDGVTNTQVTASLTRSGANTYTFDEIRARVVDGAVERILAEWAQPEGGGATGSLLRKAVIEGLIDRVLEILHKAAEAEKEEVKASSMTA